MMQKSYPCYYYTNDTGVINRLEPHGITFAYFQDIMLSKVGDEEFKDRIADFEKLLANDGTIFLTPEIPSTRNNNPYVLITGLARSGNNYTRRLFEQVSGLASGSIIP